MCLRDHSISSNSSFAKSSYNAGLRFRKWIFHQFHFQYFTFVLQITSWSYRFIQSLQSHWMEVWFCLLKYTWLHQLCSFQWFTINGVWCYSTSFTCGIVTSNKSPLHRWFNTLFMCHDIKALQAAASSPVSSSSEAVDIARRQKQQQSKLQLSNYSLQNRAR